MLLRSVLCGVLVPAFGFSGCGDRTLAETPRPVSATARPKAAGKHDRITVAITTPRPTGVFGKTRRAYVAEAHATRPASGCVNNRDRVFADAPAGMRVRARLDPARGEGGPAGWCTGRFRGTVTYTEGFACPPTGTCHPPRGFATRRRIVARFSFRVR